MKETWAIAEKAGINFANLVVFSIFTFEEFKKETGSKMLCVSQCSIGKEDDRLLPLKHAVDGGVDCIYIQGENTDVLAQNKQLDCLNDAYEYVHSQNMPFGIGAHSLQTIKDTIELGIKADFIIKLFIMIGTGRYPIENRVNILKNMFAARPAGTSGSATKHNHNNKSLHVLIMINIMIIVGYV